jgi:hypothetical protein
VVAVGGQWWGIAGRLIAELKNQLRQLAARAGRVILDLGVGSMTCRDLAQLVKRLVLVKDCIVVGVDGIATDARLAGERSHCRAARAILQKASECLAQTLGSASASLVCGVAEASDCILTSGKAMRRPNIATRTSSGHGSALTMADSIVG